MNVLKKTIRSGKVNKGNKKYQSYINVSVLIGFVLLFFWTSIFKKTFIDYKIVMALVLIPSFLAYLFLFKKYVTVCGYVHLIAKNTIYNVMLRVLVFLLVAMPVGNCIALTFLFSNQYFAPQSVRMITLFPKNIYEGKLKGHPYTSVEISFEGITKRLRLNDLGLEEIQNSKLEFKIQEGFFGYPFYEEYKIISREDDW